MGFWKARFGLEPVRQTELGATEFKGSFNECRWVEKTPEADNWAMNNMASIQSKRSDFFPDWTKQTEAEKPHLLPQDGQ
jgi:hypothetical protein